MENQIQAQSSNNQSNNQQQNQRPYGYFDAFGDALRRVLKHKVLWIWGIFLTAGGASFSRIGDSPNIEDGTAPAEFFNEFLWVIPVVIGVSLLVGIGFWIFSTIVRPGVIRALDRLQNNASSEVKHGDIWGQGKERFVSVLKLDLVVILINLGFFILMGILIAILIGAGLALQDNVGIVIFLGVLGFIFSVFFIFALIITSLIRTFGTIFVSLGDMNWSVVIKNSYHLIKNNKKETVKLILINMLVNMISGVIGMMVIGITALILIGISVAVILAFKPIGILIAVISAIVIVALILFMKSFVSLWSQDIVIWWVKKMQGAEAPQEESSEETQSSEIASQGDLVLENEGANE